MERRDFLKQVSAFTVTSSGSVRAADDTKFVVAQSVFGMVRGVDVQGIKIFKGIPYGGDTSGKNRFRPPARPAPWTGVRDALSWGHKAPQPTLTMPMEIRTLFEPFDGPQAEDCLVLNVWTPGLKVGGRRPVMVWLHGGGFVSGSGSDALYDGQALAKSGDVVVVTINHRLGCLGFLDLSDLGGSGYESSGNAGMLDIVAALKWVRDNIEGFGGDSGNVTVFGQSGGGGKVATLFGMPAAKGLFHRGIDESGARFLPVSREAATRTADLFLNELNLDRSQVSKLHEMPLERLIAAQAAVRRHAPPVDFGPVLDGAAISGQSSTPVATQFAADVPLMAGTTHDEITGFMQGDHELYSLNEQGLRSRVRAFVKTDAQCDALLSGYHRAYPEASPTDLMIQIGTDQRFRMPVIRLTEDKATLQSGPVYAYRFDWKSPAFGGKYRATHGIEVPFVFNNIGLVRHWTGDNQEAHALARKMSSTWAAFARSGNPNIKELPHWDPYTLQDRATMIFDTNSRVQNDPGGPALRAAWQGLD
ncbi:MAG TPA: carboxylesterase/lipase family protein [Terracidiphilus sp.]|nr:carboxylesterase/lipase family protein [Terracidiphilus sp.]